jgi:transposase
LPACRRVWSGSKLAHQHKLQALGHTVRLMPPSYVKAYLKRGKNDANDAAGTT